ELPCNASASRSPFATTLRSSLEPTTTARVTMTCCARPSITRLFAVPPKSSTRAIIGRTSSAIRFSSSVAYDARRAQSPRNDCSQRECGWLANGHAGELALARLHDNGPPRGDCHRLVDDDVTVHFETALRNEAERLRRRIDDTGLFGQLRDGESGTCAVQRNFRHVVG